MVLHKHLVLQKLQMQRQRQLHGGSQRQARSKELASRQRFVGCQQLEPRLLRYLNQLLFLAAHK